MSYQEKIMKIASLRHSGEWAERICTELAYLDGVSKANGGAYNSLIEKASDYLLSNPISEKTVIEAEEMLSELIPAAKSYTEMFMAHAHIDMNWMWGFQETTVVMAAESYRYVTTEVYDVVLKGRYTQDDDSKDMMDIITKNKYLNFEIIYNESIWGPWYVLRETVFKGSNNFSSWWDANSKKFNSMLSDLMDQFYE